MKDLKTYILEGSLLDDIDDILADGDVKVPRALIQKYLKENYKGKWIISKQTNKDGLYEVSSNNSITVKNINITSLTNGLFIWTCVRGDFHCSYCKSLKALDGAPKVVGGGVFCCYCAELESLNGAPEKVGDDFCCYNCKSLKTLDGAPKEVGRDFRCYDCGKLFTKDDVKKESKINGHIYC